ncbi:MAG: ABC transporter substrate-binding protein [Methanoregula sp.]|nr:ABC transporter substrate-binding protein [Methanoregula sp.]
MAAKKWYGFLVIAGIVCALLLSSGCTNNTAQTATRTDILASAAHGSTAAGNCTPVTINQTDGTAATLPCRPERLIVANANAAEMVIALGAADKIVGATDSTLSVPYIRDKIPNATSIGNWQTPNVEEILALHPDAVIAYSSYKPKNLDKITAANVTVISLDCYKLGTLASDARALGTLIGTSPTAEDYAKMVEQSVNTVTARVAALNASEKPEVYFESYTDFTAAGKGSGSDEMLTLAGGKNCVGDPDASSMKVSAEWVVARQPQYVMKVVSSSNTVPLADIVANLTARTGWNTIPAVRDNRVYAFANDVEYGPRAYIGLVYTAQILHPDTFRDLHPREMLDDYAGRYVSGTNISTVVYP